jgi:PIN domain nuclease of toxin-antitoxin system
MSARSTCVLDASAVIALLFGEDGADVVAKAVLGGGAVIGAPN